MSKFIKTFQVKITNEGELVIKNREEFENYLTYKLADKDCILTIEEKKYKRSLQQNAYYWAYLNLIEDETGNLAEDIHEIAKRKFLPPRFISVKGQEYKLPATTSNLDKKDFGDYMDKISAWCEIAIPNPEEWKFPSLIKEDKANYEYPKLEEEPTL
ncbi:TPA: hypothetical protein DIU22_04865 [Candidatus Woesebacteria bacterium]|nr:hypothetical protein [Candidatus Woesebacteria bacterium]